MAFVKENTTIKEYQNFVNEVYSFPNMRDYNIEDILINVERFIMRALKGVRKRDVHKTKNNLLISLSWFMSVMNQLHIDIENEIWNRFPYVCSYCAFCPCICKEKKISKRRKVTINKRKRPKTFSDFQNMFNKIYSPESRTIEHAGIHLAEELGEFTESILTYRGGHRKAAFDSVPKEAADLFSCLTGIFNSLGINIAKELSGMFSNNCHICKKSPCICDFKEVFSFKS